MLLFVTMFKDFSNKQQYVKEKVWLRGQAKPVDILSPLCTFKRTKAIFVPFVFRAASENVINHQWNSSIACTSALSSHRDLRTGTIGPMLVDLWRTSGEISPRAPLQNLQLPHHLDVSWLLWWGQQVLALFLVMIAHTSDYLLNPWRPTDNDSSLSV